MKIWIILRSVNSYSPGGRSSAVEAFDNEADAEQKVKELKNELDEDSDAYYEIEETSLKTSENDNY